MCKTLGTGFVDDLIRAYKQGPTADKVQELEKKISELMMENTRLRKTLELKDIEFSRGWVSLDVVHKDVKRMAEICKVPAGMVVKAELFDSSNTNSVVFKGDTFKKFIKATINFTGRYMFVSGE